jgi:ribosome-interacting GTPase 1
MPTNLPPEYAKVEARHRAATTVEEKIATLEEMLSIIPKHKGTDHLRADLRRKLSKLKASSSEKKGASRHESVYNVDREGSGQVAVIGAPNVGKSALVDALTNASPLVAAYPFSTQVPQPGMMPIDNVNVQLIDTPPLSPEFDEPQLLALIRRADAALLVIDLQTAPFDQLEESAALLVENRIIPAHFQDRYADDPRFTVIPLLVLANKADDEAAEEDVEVFCELLEEPWPVLGVSATTGHNLDALKWRVYELLDIMRIYSKPPGQQQPNYDAPFVMKRGGTLEEFAGRVHKDFLVNLKSARVWGSGVHDGQMVGRDHVLHEGDIVELRI